MKHLNQKSVLLAVAFIIVLLPPFAMGEKGESQRDLQNQTQEFLGFFSDPNVKYPNPSLFKEILEAGMAAHHKKSLQLATLYRQENKDHPCGPYALGVSHEWYIEPQIPEPYLGPALKSYEEASSIKVDHDKGFDAAAEICAGAALMRLSRIYYKYGETFRAVRRGIKGARMLEKVAEKAPDAFDVYAFLGPYHYFTDRAPKPAKMVMRLFGLKGDRELGLKELHLAWEKAPLFSGEAGHVLYVVGSKYEGRSQEYQPILDNLIERYPENVVYQRLMTAGIPQQKLAKRNDRQ